MSDYPARCQQIFDHLAQQISTRIYSPGAQLPTEQELSRTFREHRHTVREALKELKNDGLAYGIRGDLGCLAVNFFEQNQPTAAELPARSSL